MVLTNTEKNSEMTARPSRVETIMIRGVVRTSLFGILLFLITGGVFSQESQLPVKCGFSSLDAIYSQARDRKTNRDELTLSSIMRDRPTAQHHYLTRDSLFLIHYDTEGGNAVDPYSSMVTGVPDWVIETEKALHKAYTLLVDSLGFDPPPMDTYTYPQDPPGGAHDIYYRNWGYYGMTYYPERIDRPGRPNAYAGYMVFENDFSASQNFHTHGVDALHVTAAHELFHLIQLGYTLELDGVSPKGLWWYELSSSWFEDIAYPDVNDYANYVEPYFRDPMPLHKAGSDGLEGYRTAHYGFILSDYREPGLWETIWNKFVERDAYAAIDHSLRDLVNTTFAASYRKFAGWNLLTGEQARPGVGYPDADRYPRIATKDTLYITESLPLVKPIPSKDILYSRILFNAGSTEYFELLFESMDGEAGATFSLNSTPSTLTPISFGKGQGLNPAGGDDEGVLALVNASSAPGEIHISLNRNSLKTYPNPITADIGQLYIYLIHDQSTAFHARIYDLLGREVHSSRFNNQKFSAGTTTLALQLRNTPLEHVSSGPYFLHLKGSGFDRTTKLLIIR